MTPLNSHLETAGRGLRRAFLQAASDLLTARARRRVAERTRVRPRLEGLEDRCLLSPTITEFPVPSAGDCPYGITAGSDGNLWFSEELGYIDEINPTTHAISEFPVPTANADTRGITAGPDGNLWFAEFSVNKVGEINPTTHVINEFPVPTAGAGPRGISAGPDGNLWFTENAVGKIGMINPATHAISEFPVPSGSGSCPDVITAGPDGNLWFSESLADKIGEINPATHAISEFPVPTAGADPGGISAAPDGNLWFCEQTKPGNIGTINPATQAIAEFPVPYANSTPWRITAGPDGIWFTDHLPNNAIGLATLATSQLVVTQQPPSSLTAGSPFGLTVTAEDSSGNVITSFNGTVTVGLANNPGVATLGGTLTAMASNGVATFSGLSLTRAAIGYTLYASTGGYGWGISNALTVTPLAPSQLVITTQPSVTATAGQPFATQPVVYEADQYGNLETGDNSTVVTAALASGAGPLQGTTSVTVSGGVAAFTNLADNKAETLTLQFSGGGFTAGPSSAIVVSPAEATKLAITTQPPSSVVVNAGFGLVAAVEDAYGNVVPSASNPVSVALASNPSGARLGGTTKVTASQGLATFTGLSLNKVGTGYTLQVSTKGLTSATTNPFNVVNSATSSPLAATSTTGTPDLLLAPLVLDSPDLWDGLRFKKRSRSS
jgi:streptogramin lyase